MKQQTPIPQKSRIEPREGQNAQFSQPWFFFRRGEGGHEAAQRPKRTIFPWGEVGLNFPSVLSKIVVYGRSAWDTLGQGVKSTKNWSFHFFARPRASAALLPIGWGETETADTQAKRINASLNFYQQNFQLKLPHSDGNICHNRLSRTTTWLPLHLQWWKAFFAVWGRTVTPSNSSWWQTEDADPMHCREHLGEYGQMSHRGRVGRLGAALENK